MSIYNPIKILNIINYLPYINNNFAFIIKTLRFLDHTCSKETYIAIAGEIKEITKKIMVNNIPLQKISFFLNVRLEKILKDIKESIEYWKSFISEFKKDLYSLNISLYQ